MAATIVVLALFDGRNVLQGYVSLRELIPFAVPCAIYGEVAGLVYWFIAGRTAGMRKPGAGDKLAS